MCVRLRDEAGTGRKHPPPAAAGSALVHARRGHVRWPRVPHADEGRVHETPTGLQRALPHHRGEGAQALRRARRQAEGVLRVGLEVVHHEHCGRVEGPPDLGARVVGWRDETDREADTDTVTPTNYRDTGEKTVGTGTGEAETQEK